MFVPHNGGDLQFYVLEFTDLLIFIFEHLFTKLLIVPISKIFIVYFKTKLNTNNLIV